MIPRFPTGPFLNTTATALHNLSKASFRDTKATRHSLPFIALLRSYTSQFSHVLCPGDFLCLHVFGRMLPLLFYLLWGTKAEGKNIEMLTVPIPKFRYQYDIYQPLKWMPLTTLNPSLFHTWWFSLKHKSSQKNRKETHFCGKAPSMLPTACPFKQSGNTLVPRTG